MQFKRPLDGFAFVAAVLALSTLVVWLSGRLGWQLSPAEMLLVFVVFAALGRILIALLNQPKQCGGDDKS